MNRPLELESPRLPLRRGQTAPLSPLAPAEESSPRRDLSSDLERLGGSPSPDSHRRTKLPWGLKLKGFFSKLSLRSPSSTKVASEPTSPVGVVPGSVGRLLGAQHDARACRSPGAPSRESRVTSDCSGDDSGRLIVLDGSPAGDSTFMFARRSSSFSPSLPPTAGPLPQPQQRRLLPPRRNPLSPLSATNTPQGSWDGRGGAALASPTAAGTSASGPLASAVAGRPAVTVGTARPQQPPHQSHLAVSLARSIAGSQNSVPALLTAEPTSPLAWPHAFQRTSAGPPSILESASSAAAGPARHNAAANRMWREPPSTSEHRSHSSNLETLGSALTAMRAAAGSGQPAAAAAGTTATALDATAEHGDNAFTSRRARSSDCNPAAVSASAPGAAGASLLLAVSPALPPSMSRPVWSVEDYSISRRLYKGSSSAVYKAICTRSGLPVALKVYFLNRLPSNCLHMLKREIQIHTSLVHKHVARLYGAFLERGAPGSSAPSTKVVLVQEYATRGDMFDVKQKLGGRIKPAQVASLIMKPLLEALTYMHSHGILHRDIKPANVLFTTDWRLLVADFGVSINLHHERAVTRAGTEGYMAPEVERCPLKAEPQENKDKPQLAYSTAVDIWAVGCMAYELMVGFPPAIAPQRQHAPAGAGPTGAQNADGGPGCGVHTQLSVQFPATVPQDARDFICAAVAPDPRTRPTAAQLLASAWLQGREDATDAGTDAGVAGDP